MAQELIRLRDDLRKESNPSIKEQILTFFVQKKGEIGQELSELLQRFKEPNLRVLILTVVAMKQDHLLFPHYDQSANVAIITLLDQLQEVDRFYAHLGGILGYHLKVLELLEKNNKQSEPLELAPPRMEDLSKMTPKVRGWILEGVQRLSEVALFVPVGGLGARLHLMDESNRPLPVARLEFLGCTLLELIIRDVQGYEYLHYKLFGKQVTIPIALMTSAQHGNHSQIEELLQKNHYFGRNPDDFFLFMQHSAPVMTVEGQWVLTDSGTLLMQPSGHGSIWKMAEEKRVFAWLQKRNNVNKLLVRQINNPIASLDGSLLSFLGFAMEQKKSFGLMGCERQIGASEGTLVRKKEQPGNYFISNIEYTEVERRHLENDLNYPANLNILFANMPDLIRALQRDPLPGLMINMKSQLRQRLRSKEEVEIRGGRLESMMQNISDTFLMQEGKTESAFVACQKRSKIMGAIKKSARESANPLEEIETPERSYYALLKNNYELLQEECRASIGPFCDWETFMQQKGPSHLFLYHPALGPLYEIIAQKVQGLEFKAESELHLEIAELLMQRVSLSGSLRIFAEASLGTRSGKCILRRVQVVNEGIDRRRDNIYWKGQIERKQSLTITLRGSGEFFAEDVVFKGQYHFHVEDGEHVRVYAKANGELFVERKMQEDPSWEYGYKIGENGAIKIEPLFTVAQKHIHKFF